MSNEALMAGIWSFPKRVSEAALVELATDLANGEYADQFTDLHVRGTSKETFGIGFKYRLTSEDLEAEHTAVFHRLRGMFCKRFNLTQQPGDKLCWDISSPIVTIK